MDKGEPGGAGGAADGVRASDADRAHIADLLTHQAGTGRITQAELADRLGRAYAATTLTELRGLLTDLPVEPGLPVDLEATAGPEGGSWPAKLKTMLPMRVNPVAITLVILIGLLAAGILAGHGHHGIAPLGLIWILFWIAGPAWRHHHQR